MRIAAALTLAFALAACGTGPVTNGPSYVRSYAMSLVPTPDGSPPEQITDLGPIVFTTTDAPHRRISQAPLGATIDATLPVHADAFQRCTSFTERWDARINGGPWVVMQDEQRTEGWCGASGSHGIRLARGRGPRLVDLMPRAHAELPGPNAPYRFATSLAPQLQPGDNRLEARLTLECHDDTRRIAFRTDPGVLTLVATSRAALSNYRRIIAPRLVGSDHRAAEHIAATAIKWTEGFDVDVRRAVLLSDGWERDGRERIARLLAVIETDGQCEARTLGVGKHVVDRTNTTYTLYLSSDDGQWPYPCALAPKPPDPSDTDVLGSLWWPRDWAATPGAP